MPQYIFRHTYELWCKSRADAFAVVALIRADPRVGRQFIVNALCSSYPEHDEEWFIEICHLYSNQWVRALAEPLWLELARHLKNESYIAFEPECGTPWKIVFRDGRVWQEKLQHVIWGDPKEIVRLEN